MHLVIPLALVSLPITTFALGPPPIFQQPARRAVLSDVLSVIAASSSTASIAKSSSPAVAVSSSAVSSVIASLAASSSSAAAASASSAVASSAAAVSASVSASAASAKISGSIASSAVAASISSVAAVNASMSAVFNSTSSVARSSSSSSSSSTSSSVTSSSSSSSYATAVTTETAGGKTKVITEFLTASASSSSASSSSVAATTGTSKISTGAIIGIAIGVGAVVVTLIALAIWRMRSRRDGDDDAIRWPELNRHGDSSALHALPARRTGGHGLTGLERSMTNTSDYVVTPAIRLSRAPSMPLNGSAFGATSALDEVYENQSSSAAGHSNANRMSGHLDAGYPRSLGPASTHGGLDYDDQDEYTSFPPPLQPERSGTPSAGTYDWDGGDEGYGGIVPLSPTLSQRLSSPPVVPPKPQMTGVGTGGGSHVTYSHSYQGFSGYGDDYRP